MSLDLRISEIFYSLQGESSFAGQPCVFVRVTGCNLRCVWCDTAYAFTEGEPWTQEAILDKVASYDCDLVEITGGEPMCQHDGACALMRALLDRGVRVLLETNGTHDLDCVPQGVHRIIDLKPPMSRTVHPVAVWEHYA